MREGVDDLFLLLLVDACTGFSVDICALLERLSLLRGGHGLLCMFVIS